MKAIWNDTVVAESDDTVVVEENHYFPRSAVKEVYLEAREHTSTCFWKGVANYFHIVVDGERNENAAWYYPTPSQMARGIKDRIAFWNGEDVVK